MSVARHPRPADVADLSLEEIAERYIGRFRDKTPDWNAFEDAKIEGYRRAQHRFIGAGGSGKHDDPDTIPARGFGLSVMYVPPGQGNAAHTHEAEEIFFVLRGNLMVFYEEEDGRRLETTIGPGDLACCPAGVIHGYHNNSLEPVYMLVSVGKGQPDLMAYADPKLYE